MSFRDSWASFFKAPVSTHRTPLRFHNTLSNTTEDFTPLQDGVVKMYNCGPTVYAQQHIGNLSMFVFTDILRRTFVRNGYTVKQVINFTDIGHLSGDNEGDADSGEDRMTKALKKEGKALTLDNMKKLGKKYADLFLEQLKKLNIETETVTFPFASDYIPAQIAMVRALEEKGYAYVGEKGVYFDTARFPDYGKLGNIKLDGLKEGARVTTSVEKRNPTDFLLWKFDDKLGWDTPWSKGFPGWHIECSAMSRSILGDQIDIHTGGIEHIPVHHNNEIAQSEASSGKKPFARYWLHRAHLQIEGAKIAKSAGKAIYLADIEKKKFHPLAFRYLLLGSHYRSTASFTWDALQASQQAFLKLRRMVDTYPEGGTVPASYAQRFLEHINDDLNTAGVLATVWEMTKDTSLSEADIRAGIINADELLGLRLSHHDAQAKELYEKEFGAKVKDIPADVETLMTEREKARAEKRWDDADSVRAKLEEKGYIVKDEKDGPVLLKK